MFAGHIGAAMAIGRAERRVNVGVFVGAALLLDVLLWLFVLLGWESVTIPADFAATHQPEFVFPYSHGLLAAIGWSMLAAAATFIWHPLTGSRLRASALVGLAVLSHWVLDALVHAPELPLAGEGSTTVGLGLWNRLPLALALEGFVTLGGLWLFLSACALSWRRKLGLAALTFLMLAFTTAGMSIAPAPPSAVAMAASSLVTIVIVCALAAWAGKRAS
jgi:hypothetical protein